MSLRNKGGCARRGRVWWASRGVRRVGRRWWRKWFFDVWRRGRMSWWVEGLYETFVGKDVGGRGLGKLAEG